MLKLYKLTFGYKIIKTAFQIIKLLKLIIDIILLLSNILYKLNWYCYFYFFYYLKYSKAKFFIYFRLLLKN